MELKVEFISVPRYVVHGREYKTFKMAREGEIRRALTALAEHLGLTGNALHLFVNRGCGMSDKPHTRALFNQVSAALNMTHPEEDKEELRALGLID